MSSQFFGRGASPSRASVGEGGRKGEGRGVSRLGGYDIEKKRKVEGLGWITFPLTCNVGSAERRRGGGRREDRVGTSRAVHTFISIKEKREVCPRGTATAWPSSPKKKKGKNGKGRKKKRTRLQFEKRKKTLGTSRKFPPTTTAAMEKRKKEREKRTPPVITPLPAGRKKRRHSGPHLVSSSLRKREKKKVRMSYPFMSC